MSERFDMRHGAMTDTPYNPDDPNFLASQRLDGDLSPEERAALDRAIEASPELRQQAEGIAAVDGIVKRWADLPVEIDWQHHAANIVARIEQEETPEERAAIDGLLLRWKAHPVDLDEDSFTTAVTDRLADSAASRPSRTRRAWLWRLGAPLAAAAAVVITLTARFWSAPVGRSMAVVHYAATSPEFVASGPDAAKIVSIVSYARTVVDRSAEADGGGWISIGSLGAGLPDGRFSKGPPT